MIHHGKKARFSGVRHFLLTVISGEQGHANYIHITSDFTILHCVVNRIHRDPVIDRL